MAKLEIGVNDLATVNPALAAQWHPTANGDLTPDQITAGSARPVFWKYSYDVPMDYPVEHLRGKHFDFEWMARIQNRMNGTLLPPFLTGAVWQGFNDLATTHPDLAAQWHPTANGDLTPEMVTANSSKKVVWQATYWDKDLQQECTHQWPARIQNRANGTDCPQKMASKGEKLVRVSLENKGVLFMEQNVFPDRVGLHDNSLLRDDFAVMDQKGNVVGTIEFHGRQHYEVIHFGGKSQTDAEQRFKDCQVRDQMKSDYLEARGIPQLIIPYTDVDKVQELVNDFVKELEKDHELYPKPQKSRGKAKESPVKETGWKPQHKVASEKQRAEDFMRKLKNEKPKDVKQEKQPKQSKKNDFDVNL